MIQNNTFANFKPYSYYAQIAKTNKVQNKSKLAPYKALIGSAMGVGAGYLLSKKINIDKNHKILYELTHLLAMAGGANIGSVALCSIGENKGKIKKKIHEAAFQMMNTTIPMLMVGGANGICNKFAKNNNILRAVMSIGAMASGAFIATKITNATKNKNEPPRKYTIKDSIANVDDIIATIAIGFPELDKLHLDTTLMPFIYTYCGARAGAKE